MYVGFISFVRSVCNKRPSLIVGRNFHVFHSHFLCAYTIFSLCTLSSISIFCVVHGMERIRIWLKIGARFVNYRCNRGGKRKSAIYKAYIFMSILCAFSDWTCRRYKMLDNMQLFFHMHFSYVSSSNFCLFCDNSFDTRSLCVCACMFIYDCLWRKAHFDRLPHQIKQQPMTRGGRKKRHSKLHHHIESRPYSYYLWAWNPSIDGHVTNEKWQKRTVLLNKLMLRCECNILVDISISIFMPKMHCTPYMHWYAYSQCLYGCTLHIAYRIRHAEYCKLHIYTSIRT